MQEKCYRDIQERGQIGGLNLPECFILLGVPIVLLQLFSLLDIHVGFILIVEVILYALFRMANQISTFGHGVLSFIYGNYVWPRRLAAYPLTEKQYLKKKPLAQGAEKSSG